MQNLELFSLGSVPDWVELVEDVYRYDNGEIFTETKTAEIDTDCL